MKSLYILNYIYLYSLFRPHSYEISTWFTFLHSFLSSFLSVPLLPYIYTYICILSFLSLISLLHIHSTSYFPPLSASISWAILLSYHLSYHSPHLLSWHPSLSPYTLSPNVLVLRICYHTVRISVTYHFFVLPRLTCATNCWLSRLPSLLKYFCTVATLIIYSQIIYALFFCPALAAEFPNLFFSGSPSLPLKNNIVYINE